MKPYELLVSSMSKGMTEMMSGRNHVLRYPVTISLRSRMMCCSSTAQEVKVRCACYVHCPECTSMSSGECCIVHLCYYRLLLTVRVCFVMAATLGITHLLALTGAGTQRVSLHIHHTV
jgi:hypothetical protein